MERAGRKGKLVERLQYKSHGIRLQCTQEVHCFHCLQSVFFCVLQNWHD
jgi:hypothetical protein